MRIRRESLSFTGYLINWLGQRIPRRFGTVSLYRYDAASSNHHQLIPSRRIPLAHHFPLHRPLRGGRDAAEAVDHGVGRRPADAEAAEQFVLEQLLTQPLVAGLQPETYASFITQRMTTIEASFTASKKLRTVCLGAGGTRVSAAPNTRVKKMTWRRFSSTAA